MGRLDGKVAAITGGTRSIGRAMAEAFLHEGARVVINGRDEAKGRRALAELAAGDRAHFVPGDASKRSTAEGIVDAAIDHFGGLDILCLNSGGVGNTAPVVAMTDEEWHLELDWNLNSVFWGMRRALNHMMPRRDGRIIVTSSTEGKLGTPGIPGYSAMKHAVNGLVKAAAHEVGTLGITVNSILPGLIETDMVRATFPATAEAMGLPSYEALLQVFAQNTATQRLNTVEQVAAVAVLLASAAGRNITGCMFPVDSGIMPY